jgi:hypothetical protein
LRSINADESHNCTNSSIPIAVLGMLAIAAALIGAAVVSVLLPAAHAASYPQKDPGKKKNSIDIQKAKQTLTTNKN